MVKGAKVYQFIEVQFSIIPQVGNRPTLVLEGGQQMPVGAQEVVEVMEVVTDSHEGPTNSN